MTMTDYQTYLKAEMRLHEVAVSYAMTPGYMPLGDLAEAARNYYAACQRLGLKNWPQIAVATEADQ